MNEQVLAALGALGVVAFAVSGALAGARRGFDVFGVAIVAAVTAVGGGVVRDLLLGRAPVEAVAHPASLLEALVVGLAVFPLMRARRQPRAEWPLLVADAVGLAVAAALGARIALACGVAAVGAAVVGAISGSAGGILRDLLCGAVPTVLRREIYVTAALAGAVVVVAGERCGLPPTAALWAAIALTAGIRLWSVARGVELPRIEPRD